MNKRNFLKLLTGTIVTSILPTTVMAYLEQVDNETAVKNTLYNLVDGITRFEINDTLLQEYVFDVLDRYLTRTSLVYDHVVICDHIWNNTNPKQFCIDVALKFNKNDNNFIYLPIIIK